MDQLFILQIITSFLAGGSMIAGFTYLAEKAPARIAGLLLMLPTTAVVGFFFLAWISGVDAVIQTLPTAIMALAFVFLFSIVYLYLFQFFSKKSRAIFFSAIGGLLIWAIPSFTLAITKFSSLPIAFISCFLSFSLGYWYLTARNNTPVQTKKVKYSTLQHTGRSVFAGLAIVMVVILSKTVGPFWGAVFTMFPAANLSSVILISYYHEYPYVMRTYKNAPWGLLILLSYIASIYYTFPTFGFIIGTLASYIISILFFLLFKRFIRTN